VWLASVSWHHQYLGLVPNTRWSEARWSIAKELLNRVLDGVGDVDCYRLFRMNVTACQHRALTDAEIEGLSTDWQDAPAIDQAGVLVEVLETKGLPSGLGLTAEPCRDPRKQFLPEAASPTATDHSPFAEDLWIPIGCGKCDSCLAREAIRT